VRYLRVIYRHGFAWLVFCLVALPVGYILFLIRHPKESIKPVLVFACGVVLQSVGYWLSPELVAF